MGENNKKLFNMLVLFVILFWITPSAKFYNVDIKIILFYFGFHIIMSLLYVVEFNKLQKNNRNDDYEMILIYLSLVGSLVIHVVVTVLLLIKGLESNIKLIPQILLIRGILILAFIISRQFYFEEKIIAEDYDFHKDKNGKERYEIDKIFYNFNDVKRRQDKKSNICMYKILLKDLKVNLKYYMVFIISAILTVTYVYGFLGNLFIVHNIQQTNTINIGEGITTVVVNALIVITIINILIQFYALKNYLQNRMHDFKTLILLGMKKRDIYNSMIFLLVVSLLISYFIGLILGSGMIYIFSKVYSIYLPTAIIPKINFMIVSISSFVICVVVLGFVFAIVQEIAIESSLLHASNSDIEESFPSSRIRIIAILPIILMTITSIYSDPHWAESQYLIYAWLISFVVLIYYSSGYLLKKFKSKNRYYLNNILKYNLMLYKSKSYLKNSLLLFSLIFIMFLTYAFQISTLFPLETESLYPYNYICLGYDKDKKELDYINDIFDVDSNIYPVVRVTVPGGEDGGYGDQYKRLPIGHHIGISESTYKDLTGESINLNNKDIYIIYQEDKSNKAHPLDFYVKRSKPSIRIGQPRQYTPGERRVIFDFTYNLIGEERKILFGRLSNIMYENIVVFSDEYFSREYSNTDGIKWLMTINTQNNDNNLEKYLNNYKKTHTDENVVDSHVKSVYSSKDLQMAFQGEKIFSIIIYVSVFITFIIACIMIIFIHVFGNLSYYKNRYEILSYLGEKKKVSNSTIRKEISLFAIIPCILGILASFILIIINIFMRGFKWIELITSAKVYFIIILIFLILYSMSTYIIYHFLIKKIGGK